MERKLGKLPARPDAVKFKFSMFIDAPALPVPPLHFGHYNIPMDWGVLGNVKYGDCVFAGAAHETMVFLNEAGLSVSFDDHSVLSDYAAVTGFNPARPDTDNGTDMADAASYRRRVGVVDANGVRHKVDSYLALNPGDTKQLALSTYLTGATGVGLRYPKSADKQFDAKVPWDVGGDGHDVILGGHYVPCIGRNTKGDYLVVTWGRLHAMTPAFYRRYSDEALAYISLEALKDSVTKEGFNLAQLELHLHQLSAHPME